MKTDADLELDIENLHKKWDDGDRHAFVVRMTEKNTRKIHNRERSWR